MESDVFPVRSSVQDVEEEERDGTALGKGAIWSVIEKQLFRQRVLLMCAMDREKVSAFNAKAHIQTEENATPTDEYWKEVEELVAP